ncbi:M20 family metallopeptidase [Kibdelosporangium persicum]|uniref:Hippurate hydrolase n=1 Tax=Kibdelosporangium persicum TaxID=2698649 RepID=A0ABX2F5X6_9PSEU|nr:M20 family metallopeptidase [Kibdelosporangium persicum]NRN66346.1 Hippurate hydrolase [Kibdelosporangium persicum]
MNATRSTPSPSVSPLATDPRFTGLVEAARALQPRTVALRRRIHKFPERGLNLPRTQAAVLQALDGLGMHVMTGEKCTSVIAVLNGARPGPTVLLRGDMDALPLQEDSGLAYTSEIDGVMHACGHDTHTAMLVSAARLLCSRKDALTGRVIFMFQPGEEGYHGAKYMIDEGVLDAGGRPIEGAFALHITATDTSGVIRSKAGAMLAAADNFTVRITGRGGHGAIPHHALDPVPAAAAIVGALQTMVTRQISVFEPVVVTVGRITAGTTSNIIPETAELEGTFRSLSEASRARMREELPKLCHHVAAAYGCTAEVDLNQGYPVTVNDDVIGPHVVDLAGAVLGQRHAAPMPNPLMGAEDFSYVLQKVPGAFAFLGACPPGVDPADADPNHSNRVHFDESALANGVAMYAAFALDTLR